MAEIALKIVGKGNNGQDITVCVRPIMKELHQKSACRSVVEIRYEEDLIVYAEKGIKIIVEVNANLSIIIMIAEMIKYSLMENAYAEKV